MDNDKNGNGIHVKDEASAILQTAVRKARECNEQGTLLRIPYITLFEYLQVTTGIVKLLITFQIATTATSSQLDCLSAAAALTVWATKCKLKLMQYLQYLKTISDCLRPCGKKAAFYLAAAVSDFFLPWKQMVSNIAASLFTCWSRKCHASALLYKHGVHTAC